MTASGARIQEIKGHAVRSKKPIFLLGDEVPDDFDIGSLVGKATFCAYSPTWLLETGLAMGIKPHLIVCGNRADIASKNDEWIELIRRVGKETNIIFADPIISRYIKNREDVDGCRIVGFGEVARTNPHFFDEDAKLHENSPLWFAMKVCALLRHRPIVVLDTEDCDEKTQEADDDGVDIFGAKFLYWGKDTAAIRAVVPKIVLVTQQYIPEKRRRKAELEKCLRKNLENPFIDRVVLLNEDSYTDAEIGVGGSHAGKLDVRVIGHRLTQEKVFEYARDVLDDYSVVVLANADIQFEGSLRQIYEVDMDMTLFALLRFDESTVEGVPHQIFGPRPDSQDAWIFSSRIPDRLNLTDLRIPLGIGGCDNAVLSPLRRAGYNLVNPAGSIQAIHVHASGVRTWKNQPPIQSKEYILLPPTYLGDFDVINDITPYMDRLIDPDDDWTVQAPVHSHEIRTYMNYINKSFGVKVAEGDGSVAIKSETMPCLVKFENIFTGDGGIMQSMKENKSFAQKSVFSGLDIRVLSEVVPSHALYNPIQPGWEEYGSFALQILPKLVWWSRQEEAKHCPALCPFSDDYSELLKSFNMNKMNISVYRKNATYYNNVVYHTEALNKQMVNRDWLRGARTALKEGWGKMMAPRMCVVVCDGPIQSDTENQEMLVGTLRAKYPSWRFVCVQNNSPAKSRKAFAQAHTVISYTSDHLGNMIFAPETCRIIQIQQEETPHMLQWMAANALGLKQGLLPVKREPTRRQAEMVSREIGDLLDSLGDVEIDESDFIITDPEEVIHPEVPEAETNGDGGDDLDVQDKLFMKKGKTAMMNELADDGNRNEVADAPAQERSADGRVVIRVPADVSGGLRELFQMWEEKGFIQIEPSDDDMTWIGGVGNILLWNRVGNIPRGLAYKRALFGKTDLIEKELPLNCTIWGSYTDHVRDLEVIGSRVIGVNRDGGVVFMGRITDKGTLIKRAGKRWSGACDQFDLVPMSKEIGDWSEYMERVSDAKWGLCLPGNHGRTSREIEYMAAGVPLILTPGVSVNYPEELREGEHFVFAENPDDIGIVTAGVSDEQWASMSKACREQYARNFTAEGLWRITQKLGGF